MVTNSFETIATRAPKPVPPAKRATKDETRYTINLTRALRAAADEDVERLRRDTGFDKIDRSDVIRELIRVLHSDESLYEQLLRRFQAKIGDLP